MSDQDVTKPASNDEKFKPQNVKGSLKTHAPDDKRGAPADTEGYDIEQGSSGVTKSTPAA